MASSGTINNTFRTGYAIRITWSVGSQSVANNTSSVTANVQLVSLGSSYTINSSATKNGSLTINGTTYNFTFTAQLAGNQVKTIHTRTVTVAHNANGTKTCPFSCSAGINVTLSGTYYGTVTASGSGVFNTIARASTIASVTSSVSVTGSNAVTVSITRAVSSFTHTVVFSFGSYSNTQTNVGTSASYTVPMSWLNAIPNATSGTAKVTVSTFSGSTKIGSDVSKTFTITVPTSVVPSISGVSIAESVAGLAAQFAGYVQNKSMLNVTVTAAGAYSSTVKAYKATLDGITYTTRTFASGLLKTAGSRTLSITVTDSRGRTASTTRTITVLAYSAPTISDMSAYRVDANGAEDYNGTGVKCLYKWAISSVNNKNTSSYVFAYRIHGATTWTTLASGTGYTANTSRIFAGIASPDASYDLRLSITDYFGTIRKTMEIPTAFTLMDFNKTGRAVAFGKVSQMAEGVEFALPAIFANGEAPNGTKTLASGTNLNSVNQPGYYAFSSAVLATMTNCPVQSGASGGVLVHTMGEAGQLMQLAVRCSDVNVEIWQRFYFSSAWRAWRKIYQSRKILWSGAMYMTAGHTATLEEKVSEQPSGIILVFSRYSSGTAQNYHFNEFFVHKEFVANHPGAGSQFLMTTDGSLSVVASKYLYIHDDRITGNAINNASGTGSGITYNNAGFVLRYVIGV